MSFHVGDNGSSFGDFAVNDRDFAVTNAYHLAAGSRTVSDNLLMNLSIN